MKKLTIGTSPRAVKRRVIGANSEIVDVIEQIADRTHRKMIDVTNTLLKFALENVIINDADSGAGE